MIKGWQKKGEGKKPHPECVKCYFQHCSEIVFRPTLQSKEVIFCLFVSCFVVALGFELWASHLLGRHSSALATPPALLLWLFWM
jgi:hypothetical protein